MPDFTVFNLDFSKYEENELPSQTKLPEGTYLMRFVDAKMVTVKNEHSVNFGAPGILVTLEVVNGPLAGKKIEDRLWHIEKALFRLDQFFSALGVQIEKKEMNIPVAQVLNRSLAVTVKDGAPFGENQIVRSEVKKYAAASTITGEKPAEDTPQSDGGIQL